MFPTLLVAAVVGIADPFTPPPEGAQHDNGEGFKLFRNREYAKARPLFERAIKAAPEYDAARYNLATSWAAEHRWDAALREVDTLLVHNYPRYAHQILTDPDWAPIKVAREMNQLKAKLERGRAAYSAGLDKTVLLIARVRPPIDSPVGSESRTFRHAEIYAFDLASNRWRQLTETAGRVIAFVRSPDGRRLGYATQEKSRIVGGVYGRLMEDVQVFDLDLKTLEGATPPRATPEETSAFSMTYMHGELRLGVATPSKNDEALVVPSAGELVVVHATDVTYYPPQQGPPLPRLGMPIDPVSVTWSPLRNRVLFRRHVPACALGRRRGELYLYEPATKQTTRIMSASALFDAIWLGDDSFAFEDGLGTKSAVRVWRAGKLTTLKMPHGGGLRAIPELPACGA